MADGARISGGALGMSAAELCCASALMAAAASARPIRVMCRIPPMNAGRHAQRDSTQQANQCKRISLWINSAAPNRVQSKCCLETQSAAQLCLRGNRFVYDLLTIVVAQRAVEPLRTGVFVF